MTQMEELQKQIDELKKTVTALQMGTEKVVPIKQQLLRKELNVFGKYFVTHDEAKKKCPNSNWPRLNDRLTNLRAVIREGSREIYRLKSGQDGEHIFHVLGGEEQQAAYIEIYEKMCQFFYAHTEDSWVKREDVS